MSEWIISIAGTQTGHNFAIVLALAAAVLHALVSAMQKGWHDPFTSRAAIDLFYGLGTAPLALFVVPWPEPYMWPIFAGAIAVHSGYKLFQAMAFSQTALTVVYPVIRGTGMLISVFAAGIVFGEKFSPIQWCGVIILLGGLLGLAAYNLAKEADDRSRLAFALLLSVTTGIFVAGYTTVDAYGIRATANPFTFLAWLFFLDGFFMPVLAFARWRRHRFGVRFMELARLGFIGAIVAVTSFGAIMLATRVSHVGEIAVLRETSTLFAALIGWFFLKEAVGSRRLVLIAMIAIGAILVETKI
ncbi:MAG: EamA family transporter [Albidovulum sp.]|nr:EamA family transporter [Albidovulum sp.]